MDGPLYRFSHTKHKFLGQTSMYYAMNYQACVYVPRFVNFISFQLRRRGRKRKMNRQSKEKAVSSDKQRLMNVAEKWNA